MTHLRIEQSGLAVENVSESLIKKLYETVLKIPRPEEGEEDNAYMSGHISVDYSYEAPILYLISRFQDLTITVTGGLWILFLDDYVKNICSTNWASGQNPTIEHLAAVTSLADKFRYNTDIVHFDEFKHFTGLSEVAQLLFLECSHLLNITLPNTITSLSNGAFMRCYDLTSINLANITTIGNSTFSEDSELVIDVADISKVTSIGGEAFIKCKKIYGDLNLPRLTTVGNGAFNSCGSITKITCLGTLAVLPLFFMVKQHNSTSLLEEVYLPYECTEILWNAFNGNNNLTTIKQYTTSVNNWIVGEDPQYTNISRVAVFGHQCFQGCSSLQITTTDLSGATSIGNSSFKQCSLLSGELNLPNLTSLGTEAFSGTGITSITSFGSVASVSDSTFSGMDLLQSVSLSSVTSLPAFCFRGRSNLKYINFPNLTNLGAEAFNNCDLENLDLNLPLLQNTGYSCFSNTKIKTVSNFGNVSTLGEAMFSGCSKLESITLPSSCTTINNGAIYNAPNLTSINVDNVVNIKNNNFAYCTNLPNVMWFKSLRTLLYQNANSYGHLTLQPTRHLYLPALEETCLGYDTGGNTVAGLFTIAGWGNTCSSFDIVYFKNLTTIKTGCFCGSTISKLVINNTIPPTVIQSADSRTVDSIIGSTQSRTDIVDIYVPDSAVNTYKDSTNYPYWAALSSRIHPISDLSQVADEEAFNALSESDKLGTLITAYM